MVDKINLAQKFSLFASHFDPKIVAQLNDHEVKLVKFQGPFVWHRHDAEDELFLVHKGRFTMEFRDGRVLLEAGDLIVVPCGVEHRPVAEEEVEVLLVEPASTTNTGNVTGDRTVERPERI